MLTQSHFALFIVRNKVPIYRQFIKQGLLYTVELIDSFSDEYRFKMSLWALKGPDKNLDIFDYARVPNITQNFQPM